MTANPSRDQANDDEMSGMFLEVLDKFLSKVDGMLPAIVVKYDAEKNRATVKPLVMRIDTSGELYERADLPSVPVFQIGGGGYMLRFNLKEGDLGWIKANDRDISLFLQSYDQAKPNTFRKHVFDDAVFFPDVMRNYSVTDGEDCVLQSTDGSVRIALLENLVRITATDVEINGNLAVSGDVVAVGEVAANAASPATQVTLSGHTHTSAAPGSPTSAPIVPEV